MSNPIKIRFRFSEPPQNTQTHTLLLSNFKNLGQISVKFYMNLYHQLFVLATKTNTS